MYVGTVTPRQAWDALKDDPDAILVDVRAVPEWTFVGVPNLAPIGKDVLKLSWRVFPTMQVNENFINQLQEHVQDKQAKLFFICRTGGRSHEAAEAATEAGYTHCYNVVDGFEGPVDEERHRGVIAGWKAEGLSWEQN